MSRKVTFDSSPSPGTVNFGVGQPSPDLLPVGLLRSACVDFLDNAHPQHVNYGDRQGDPAFLDALSRLLATEHGAPASPDSLFVTAGNSQALDFVCTLFTRPGDVVIVEEPSYFLAFRIFEDHGLNIVSVPVDEDGMDVDALELVLARTKPALLYTIPSFHNPSSRTLSRERRERLVGLSRTYGFPIVADEVYQMLWYDEPPPPALGTMIDRGEVLSLGSFSKILAPALRLGWIQASPRLLDRLLDAGVVNSGGSFNQFTSRVAAAAIESGLQLDFLETLRRTYASRVRIMDEALREHLGDVARWKRPEGGYFFWLELDESVDTTALRPRADALRTGYQPGENSSSAGGLKNCLRLSFAHYGEDQIRDGIARLSRLFDEIR
ncbi:MAG: PLP-dependent aminotransferase family protein [Xanthomonadales bacterium]|nr:PLP-dependent aminotransferase family protein [Xanthomonadales bacterium]